MFFLLFSVIFSKLKVNENDEKSFLSWMRSTDQLFYGDDYQFRFGIWLTNYRFVRDHNKNNNKYKLEMNKFAALTYSEYQSMFVSSNGIIKTDKMKMIEKMKTNTLSIDWREKGAVNEIQDMGNCPADWAFSGASAAEGSNFIAHQTLWKFSEQSFIDCDDDCFGCNGGAAFSVFDYMYTHCNGKAMLESEYPYKGSKGTCKFDVNKAVGTLTDMIGIEYCDEEDLAAKCEQYGPVTAMIDATHPSFQLYSSGIYDEPNCKPTLINFYTTIVGFGIENNDKYWIVRNAWGKSWGEKGYIRMIKDNNNQCGEAGSACVPVS